MNLYKKDIHVTENKPIRWDEPIRYTDHFIFRFLSLLCLRRTLRLFQFWIFHLCDPMPNLKMFCHSFRHEMVSNLFPFLTSINELALRLFDLILFFLRLRLIYWSTLKIGNDLHIFASYYAFVIVYLTWLAYFLSRDYLSYINSLGSLFIFCFSLTKGQCSKR